MRIEGEFKKSGYFWLPTVPDKKVPGVLTIKNGGDIKLEVVGLFDMSFDVFGNDNNLNRIVGCTSKN